MLPKITDEMSAFNPMALAASPKQDNRPYAYAIAATTATIAIVERPADAETYAASAMATAVASIAFARVR